jgi:hypothetical protein
MRALFIPSVSFCAQPDHEPAGFSALAAANAARASSSERQI